MLLQGMSQKDAPPRVAPLGINKYIAENDQNSQLVC